jgi:hypothetical protein
MGAHPWKAEDLVVDDWYESADEHMQHLIDTDALCPVCCSLNDWSECQCTHWDEDCWVGKERPWESPLSSGRLSAKGVRMRRACLSELDNVVAELHDRRQTRTARRKWMLIRDAVDARRIGFYWMEAAQRALCAPDGAGRAADAVAFASEF